VYSAKVVSYGAVIMVMMRVWAHLGGVEPDALAQLVAEAEAHHGFGELLGRSPRVVLGRQRVIHVDAVALLVALAQPKLGLCRTNTNRS
jgi:hypothetical protein